MISLISLLISIIDVGLPSLDSDREIKYFNWMNKKIKILENSKLSVHVHLRDSHWQFQQGFVTHCD